MPADRAQQRPDGGGAGSAQPQSEYDSGASGGGASHEAREKVKRAASETQHKLGDQLSSGIDSVRQKAASRIDSIAGALVQSGQQVRERDPDAPAQYVERVGEGLQRASSYLRDTDLKQAAQQLEDLARRQPALFLGAAFSLGLLGARFIKSSQRAEQQDRMGETSRDYGRITDRERPLTGFAEPGSSFRERPGDGASLGDTRTGASRELPSGSPGFSGRG